MRTSVFILMLLAGVLTLRADQHMDVFTANGQTYTNVTITFVSATDVFFSYPGGMGNVKLKHLSPELQQHFHYDPDKAGAAQAKQAQNQADYHAQLIHQPAVKAPDMSRQPADNHAAKVLWRTDFDGALSQAHSDNKLVLLDFTGSDWCPWCIKFDQDVLSTDRFNGYAQANLELVKVDFPRHTTLPGDQQAANDALAKRFRVDGFPTYVLLTADGRELGRQVGYLAGGPDAFVNELDGFSKK